ncbi:MAG: hypothetical protein IT329_02630 [Caldilineaceae bacterium]|nr:hypothetical protein [Caldilineaceae bacterium]
MSAYQHDAQPSFWDGAKRFLFYVAIIAVAIWLFTIATEARSLAQSNAELVQTPIYQMTMVPGGPVRFSSQFEDALEARVEQAGDNAAEMPALEPADYLWMTLVIRNVGERSANSLALEVTTTAPIQQLLFTAPGWRNEAAIDYEAGTPTADVSFEALGVNDEALLFIALSPQAFDTPYTEETHRMWARSFEIYFEKAHVESDLAEALLYGHGYVTPEEEAEQS